MSIRKWFDRRWREWGMRNSILVMFVPWRERGDQDAVAAIIPGLTERLKGFPPQLVLDRALHHLHDALMSLGARFAPRRIVLFAHPTDAHDGFAVNPDRDVGISVLQASWWIGASPVTMDLLVAHVCNGATVLRQPRWSHVATKWISFDCGIDAYLGSAVGRECWIRVAEEVVSAAVNGLDASSVQMRVHRAYVDALIELHDRKDFAAGDTINICNMERALRHLVNSEDVA